VFSTVVVLKDINTGEWSDDKSRHDFALRQWFGIPLTTQKSIKSGTFFYMTTNKSLYNQSVYTCSLAT
jgi:hypothetical protein